MEQPSNRIGDREKRPLHRIGSMMARNALADRSNLIDVCCKQTPVGDSQQKFRVGQPQRAGGIHNAPVRSHRRCRALSWQDLLLLFSIESYPATKNQNPPTFLGACMNLGEHMEEVSLEALSCFASSSMKMSHHAQVFDSQYVERCVTDAYQGRQRLASQAKMMKRVQHNLYQNARDDHEELRDRSCDLRAWRLTDSWKKEPITVFSLGEDSQLSPLTLSPVSLLSSLDYSISDESLFDDFDEGSSLAGSTYRIFQHGAFLEQLTRSTGCHITSTDRRSFASDYVHINAQYLRCGLQSPGGAPQATSM